MKQSDYDDFVKQMAGLLKPLSFRKKDLTWINDGETVTKIINIQKSQWGHRVYLNWGICIRAYLKKSVSSILDAHISGRFDSLIGDDNLNFENDISIDARNHALEKLLNSDPFGFFTLSGTPIELSRLVSESKTGFLLAEAVDYLRKQ